MQAFGFASPKTVDEAVALLTESAGNARVLGGGTDLIAQLDEGRIKTELVIDVKRIPQLTDLNYSPQTGLELGAATPCYRADIGIGITLRGNGIPRRLFKLF